jgi:hypothetical protein
MPKRERNPPVFHIGTVQLAFGRPTIPNRADWVAVVRDVTLAGTVHPRSLTAPHGRCSHGFMSGKGSISVRRAHPCIGLAG